MIVEDRLDRGMSWVGHIKQLEKLDELAASVAILDAGVDLAGEQVDASQQADGTVALVFMIAGDGRVNAGHRRQVRSGQADRLHASRHRTRSRPRRQTSFASSAA